MVKEKTLERSILKEEIKVNKSNKNNIKNIRTYFILVFIYSWTLWTPFVLTKLEIITLPEKLLSLEIVAVSIGAFSPFLAALTLAIKDSDWKGVKGFIKKGFNFKVKPIYIILALIIPAITTAGTHYLVNITGIDNLPATFLSEDLPVPMIVAFIGYFLITTLVGGGQEEFGWRGYAQEPLQQRFGLVKASLIIGVIWGLWHLPLWYMPSDGHGYYSFISFMGLTLSLSIIMGLLYNVSGNKLIVPWILHGMNNAIVPFFPVLHMKKAPQPGYWIWVGINVLVAFSLVIWYSNSKVSPPIEAIKGNQ